jgi:hypothetical protein
LAGLLVNSPMGIEYIPLLGELKRLYSQPRSMARFHDYLATMIDETGDDLAYPPLNLANPMAKEDLLEYVNALLAMDADAIVREAIEQTKSDRQVFPGRYQSSLMVMDDLKGGWTNRTHYEYTSRRVVPPALLPPKQRKRYWITGILWSSETPSPERAREAMLNAIYRLIAVETRGEAKTIGALLEQEAWVMAKSGTILPELDVESAAITREVIAAHRDVPVDDMPTTIECLFGDEAAQTLGYAGKCLEPWAGLRWALHAHRAS